MKLEKFKSLLNEFQERESSLLDVKRDEYASQDADVLENFASLAQLLRRKPEQVAAVLLAKHIQSILKQVEEGSYTWDWEAARGEGFKQRISDARNYLILLAACIEDGRDV